MKTYILKDGQKPSEETLKRLSELKDEDIVYDDDCPELTPKMEQAFSSAVAQRKEMCKDMDEEEKSISEMTKAELSEYIDGEKFCNVIRCYSDDKLRNLIKEIFY